MSTEDFERMRKKARALEKNVELAKKSLAGKVLEGRAAGGRIVARVSGDQTLLSIEIADEVIDRARAAELKAMILEAVNDALGRSKDLAQVTLARAAGGVRIPGLL